MFVVDYWNKFVRLLVYAPCTIRRCLEDDWSVLVFYWYVFGIVLVDTLYIVGIVVGNCLVEYLVDWMWIGGMCVLQFW